MGRIQLNTRLPLFHPARLYFRLLIIPWFPWHLPLCSCHFSKLSCSACVLLGFTTLPTCIYLHLCRDLHACEAIKIKGSLTAEQSAGAVCPQWYVFFCRSRPGMAMEGKRKLKGLRVGTPTRAVHLSFFSSDGFLSQEGILASSDEETNRWKCFFVDLSCCALQPSPPASHGQSHAGLRIKWLMVKNYTEIRIHALRKLQLSKEYEEHLMLWSSLRLRVI